MVLVRVKMLKDTRWANVELAKDMVLEVDVNVGKRWATGEIATLVGEDVKINVFDLNELRIPKTDPVIDKDRKMNDMIAQFIGDSKKGNEIANKIDGMLKRMDGLEKENKELKKYIEDTDKAAKKEDKKK